MKKIIFFALACIAMTATTVTVFAAEKQQQSPSTKDLALLEDFKTEQNIIYKTIRAVKMKIYSSISFQIVFYGQLKQAFQHGAVHGNNRIKIARIIRRLRMRKEIE